MPLFLWTLSRIFARPGYSALLAAGFAGGLLILSFQPAPAIVLAMAVPFAFAAMPAGRRLAGAAVVAAIPVAVTGGIVVKNGIQVGVFAPTTSAGQNILQSLNMAMSSPTDTAALELGKALGYPQWWVWCYEHAAATSKRPVPRIDSYYGTCDRGDQTGESGRIVYDFGPLKSELARLGESELLRVVGQDEATVRERPWLFAGGVEDRTTRFSARYSEVSSRILVDTILRFPRNFLGRVYLNLEIFVIGGARFGLDHYPAVRLLSPSALELFFRVLVPLVIFGMFAGFASVLLVPVWAAASLCLAKVPRPVDRTVALWILSVGFGVGVFASVGLHCCENNRHAFNYLALIAAIGTLALCEVGRLLARREAAA